MPHVFGFRVVCVLLLIVPGIKCTVCRKNVKGFSFVCGGWTQGMITPVILSHTLVCESSRQRGRIPPPPRFPDANQQCVCLLAAASWPHKFSILVLPRKAFHLSCLPTSLSLSSFPSALDLSHSPCVLIICLSRLVVQEGRYILVVSEVLTVSTAASRLLQLLSSFLASS
jgi:hypothetical protein